MTAPTQMQSEPEQRLAKAIEGVSKELLVSVLKGELLAEYIHAESLQAEVDALKVASAAKDRLLDQQVDRADQAERDAVACGAKLLGETHAKKEAERKLAAAVEALNGLLINCPICGGNGQVETGAIQRGVPFWRDCGYCVSALKVYNEVTK